jgi:hypothetical protein
VGEVRGWDNLPVTLFAHKISPEVDAIEACEEEETEVGRRLATNLVKSHGERIWRCVRVFKGVILSPLVVTCPRRRSGAIISSDFSKPFTTCAMFLSQRL